MDSTIDEMVGMSQYAKNILQTGNKTNMYSHLQKSVSGL